MANYPDAAADSEQSGGSRIIFQLASDSAGEQTASLGLVSLRPLPEESRENEIQCSAAQCVLETSTDTDVITAAAQMAPQIEWPEGVFDVLSRLFRACFDSTRHTLPLAQARAAGCLKAICHLHIKLNLKQIIYLESDGHVQYFRGFRMSPDHDFLVLYCATNQPLNLDINSLSSSDRMWLAHIFTYRLHNGDKNPHLVTFVIDFVRICIGSESSSRLIADCLLLAGMLVGLIIDRECLAKLDKK